MRRIVPVCLALGLLTACAARGHGTITSEWLSPLTSDHMHGSTVVQLPGGELLAGWLQGSGERQRLWLWLLWYNVVANRWETSLPRYRISVDYAGEGPPALDWQDALLFKPGGSTERGIQADDPFVVSVRQRLAANGIFEPKGASELWEAHARSALSNARGENTMRRGRRIVSDAVYVEQPMGYPHFRRQGSQTRNKPLFLGSGRMIVPFYLDGFGFSMVALTNDGGLSWHFSAPLVGAGNIQPALRKRRDATLVAFMRDNGPPPKRLHVTTSADDGMTWSDVVDSDLPNLRSATDLVVLENGSWVLVFNESELGRHRLTVALSEDEGRSWPVCRALEDNPAARSYYPAVIQTADSKLHVLYSHHLECGKTVKRAAFDEAGIRGR